MDFVMWMLAAQACDDMITFLSCKTQAAMNSKALSQSLDQSTRAQNTPVASLSAVVLQQSRNTSSGS